jgi:hypothetical protein
MRVSNIGYQLERPVTTWKIDDRGFQVNENEIGQCFKVEFSSVTVAESPKLI